MTTDAEARNAVSRTWGFLLRLHDAEATPGLTPKDRELVRQLLRHYPYPCCMPSFAATETISGRTYDAIETLQDISDAAPAFVDALHAVLDLLTEFQGMICDERKRNTETKGPSPVADGLPSMRDSVG